MEYPNVGSGRREYPYGTRIRRDGFESSVVCSGNPPAQTHSKGGARMFATMLMLGLLAATAIASAVVQFGRDGYRRTPTISR